MKKGHIAKVEPAGWWSELCPGNGICWHALDAQNQTLCGQRQLPMDGEVVSEPQLREPAAFVCASCLQIVKGGWLNG